MPPNWFPQREVTRNQCSGFYSIFLQFYVVGSEKHLVGIYSHATQERGLAKDTNREKVIAKPGWVQGHIELRANQRNKTQISPKVLSKSALHAPLQQSTAAERDKTKQEQPAVKMSKGKKKKMSCYGMKEAPLFPNKSPSTKGWASRVRFLSSLSLPSSFIPMCKSSS